MNRNNRDWFTQQRVVLFAVVSWFVVTILGEVLGNTVNAIFGQTIGNYLLLISSGVVLLSTVVWVVLVLLARPRDPVAVEETPPPPRLFAPPTWHRPKRLCGRRNEVAWAVRLVRQHGIVVVVGERDVGTSSVGRAVAQELVDHDGVDPLVTHRFDLRSRSASTPDDALTTAARVASAWDIAPPTEEAMLDAVAGELVGKFRESGGTLLLDNVNKPDQVEWLVQAWPSDGPRLVVVGETALAGLAPDRTATVGEMSPEDMRELWRTVRQGPVLPWYESLFRRRKKAEPEQDLNRLLRACLGRPGAVIALAQEVSRPGSKVTFVRLLEDVTSGEGQVHRMWRAILENVRAGLSADADWLLTALATLPVTSLIEGAATAMLGAGGPDALRELQTHNLVEKVESRYRLPQEYRHAIERITPEEDRRTVAAKALPALSRFYRTIAEQWATRLELEPDGAGRWFTESEPSFRPLYGASYPDELLLTILDDLCSIADALTRWYLRIQRPDLLLLVHKGLRDLAYGVKWWDVVTHAAIRQATAHRMAGVHGRTHRFDDAGAALDEARRHREQVSNPHVRDELDARERVERALLAVDRGAGLDEAYADVSQLRVASPAVLINLGVLQLGRGEQADALGYLRRAKTLADDVGDQGAWAHSVELEGVVRAHDDLAEAVQAWLSAKDTFARIGERQGEARCLQHLGAAALTGEHQDAQAALDYLEESTKLRPRQETPLANEYLKEARRRLE